MSYAKNGNVDIFYETFGDASDPTLVLISGLGSQCINYAVDWCEMFVAEGYHVIRLDNRDVGLSTKLPDTEYSLADMANDVVAVLDAEGIERAHLWGVSMGGMIAQRVAIGHRERVLSLTSVMSNTGEKGYGGAAREAYAALVSPPATNRDEAIAKHVLAIATYGSDPSWIVDEDTRARAAAAYDRCFDPAGQARQLAAIGRDGSRDEALRQLDLPTLVIHGSRDKLIMPSGGQHTAEVIPGATYVEIEKLGHDYPRAAWKELVATWSRFAAAVPRE